MMTCEEFADKVGDYLEGRLPYGERIGMWMHKVMCKHCRRYARQMREVLDLTTKLGEREREEPAPDEVKSDLVEQFRSRSDDGE